MTALVVVVALLSLLVAVLTVDVWRLRAQVANAQATFLEAGRILTKLTADLRALDARKADSRRKVKP